MKRPALQNKRVVVLLMALRARKVFISQLSALTGVSRSNSCSFAPVKERRSKATEQDLPPTTTAAEVRSEGEESISKDRIFNCPSMRRHKRAVERDTLFDKAAVGYAQKLEEKFPADPQLIF